MRNDIASCIVRRCTAVAALLTVTIGGWAQGSFREEFDSFALQIEQSFKSFRQECNDQYVEFLREAWQEFYAIPATPEPEDDMLPPVIYDGGKEEDIHKDDKPYENVVPEENVVPLLLDVPQPGPIEPVQPVIEKAKPLFDKPVLMVPELDDPVQDNPVLKEPVLKVPVIEEPIQEEPVVPVRPAFEFMYYGTPVTICADDALRFKLRSAAERDVADMWSRLKGTEYDALLADCLRIRSEYRLCDWAYLMMLDSFAKAFMGSGNEAVLLTAYLFSQSGYQTRLGRAGNVLCMLYGCEYTIYGVCQYSLDGGLFYVLNGNYDNLRIAAGFKFPGEQSLSMEVRDEPLLAADLSAERHYKSVNKPLEASCSVNMNLLRFFDAYPTSQFGGNVASRWALYANAPMDSRTREQLYPALQAAIADKSELEAVGILLDFVQTALEYEYDDVVWGQDRAFFAEESLHYSGCDCEDRSILFSRLVRDLLGLDVILVYYPGHLATAVRFSDTVDGDCIIIQQGRFTVCDPTFINAPVGETMPGMDNSNTTVILLR